MTTNTTPAVDQSIIDYYKEFVVEMVAEGCSMKIIKQAIIDFYGDAKVGEQVANLVLA